MLRERTLFQMIAPTLGWIGIGFSDTSSMRNADFIIAGESDDGKDYIFVSPKFVLSKQELLQLYNKSISHASRILTTKL